MEAVKQNGWALEYVKNQTNEICFEAVRQNGLALKFVKNPTKKMCLISVENNPKNIRFVDKKKFPEIWDKYVIKNI